jgi:hypothetical protein
LKFPNESQTDFPIEYYPATQLRHAAFATPEDLQD